MPTVNDEANIQQQFSTYKLKVGRKLVENFQILFAWVYSKYINYWEDIGNVDWPAWIMDNS